MKDGEVNGGAASCEPGGSLGNGIVTELLARRLSSRARCST